MLTLLATFALVYGAFVLLIYFIQQHLIYFPARDLIATPRAVGMPYEDVWLATEDNVRVHGWFIATPGARATVLHLHGNAGNISHRLERIKLFAELGLSVFLVDYRGYGQSEGRPSEEGTYRDARAAWRYLTERRGLRPDQIVVHGESLGGAVATWLAAQHMPRALIVESGFTSLAALGAELYPWLPVRWLLRYRYPSAANLERVRAPVLVIHSRDDEIIPFHHGRALHAAAREPKQLLELNGSHNDGFYLNREYYARGVQAFLRILSPEVNPASGARRR